MNISITVSSIIGGILIIAISTLNIRMTDSSNNNTMYNTVKTQMDVITELANYDIRKLGYRSDNQPVIITANQHEISFRADINNDGFANLVTWKYDTTAAIAYTQNPGDHLLNRVVTMEDGSVEETDLSLVVTKFEFNYFNVLNESIDPETAGLDQIQKIALTVNTESEYPYGERYARSAWEQAFTPRNLQL